MAYKEANPYKKVWDTVEDQEDYLVAQASNNTLFAPTAGELALRHAGQARYLLAQAREYGRRNREHGVEVFNEAMIHVRFAKRFWNEHNMILGRSR